MAFDCKVQYLDDTDPFNSNSTSGDPSVVESPAQCKEVSLKVLVFCRLWDKKKQMGI